MAQRPCHPSLPGGPPRLRRVFDDHKIMTLGQGHDSLHVCWPTSEMHWQERSSAGRNTRLGASWIKSIRVWINIGKDRYSPDLQRCRGRRDKSIPRHDNFVPQPHTGCGEGQLERHRAIGDGNAMRGFLIRRELGLKTTHFATLLRSPAATLNHSLDRLDFFMVPERPARKGGAPYRFSSCYRQMRHMPCASSISRCPCTLVSSCTRPYVVYRHSTAGRQL